MATTSQFIFSALYVAFTYACIGFGALYFRRVVDRLNIKHVQLGEELFQLFDPRAFVAIGFLAFFFCIFALILLLKLDVMQEQVHGATPGLIFLVTPMVLVVNMFQIYYRAKWQRTSVRTNGILIQRMFSEAFFVVKYDQQPIELVVSRESLWFKVVFHDMDGRCLGQCSVSAKGLLRLVRNVRSATFCMVQSGDIQLE